jgi:acetoin utilization deacetylase AcuC-like enzyme
MVNGWGTLVPTVGSDPGGAICDPVLVRVLLYTHPACLEHDPGPWHPEKAARIGAAVEGARRSGQEILDRQAPLVAFETLYAVHDREYVAMVKAVCEGGGGAFDADTVASPGSWQAALHAAGAGPAAIEAMERGEGDTALLAVRPPGHHARRGQAMGFCLFNNIAVAAEAVVARGSRVAIVDWDVHHGNSTQEMFYERRDVLYISTHEFPFYPGTGWVDETGDGDGAGFTINLPFPPGTAGDAYDQAWERVVVPVLTAMRPDWILVSAGYDGHRDDPLAGVHLGDQDFGRMAHRLAEIAPGRAVLFLEGGYDLSLLTTSVEATLRGMGGQLPPLTGDKSPPRSFHMLDVAVAQVARFWDVH